MNILEMCDWEAASVPLEATVEQAIRAMLDRRVGAVAVIDENRRVAGIFTERDVLRLSLGEQELRKIPVRQVMTAPVEMATRATTAGGMLSIRNLLQARIDTLTHQLDQVRLVVL